MSIRAHVGNRSRAWTGPRLLKITVATIVMAFAITVLATMVDPLMASRRIAAGGQSENIVGQPDSSNALSDHSPMFVAMGQNSPATGSQGPGFALSAIVGNSAAIRHKAHESPATLLALPAAESVGVGALQDCQVEFLAKFSGRIRRDESWNRNCDSIDDSGATSRHLRFSIDDWSFVRTELVSLDNVSIRLGLIEDQDVRSVTPSAGRVLLGGPNIPEGHAFAWRQDVLQAGTYQIDLRSHEPESPGRFIFTMFAQTTPPPPFKFTSLSVGYLRSCGLIEGGTPLCWGLGIKGADVAVAAAPMQKISVGTSTHVCGLKQDGSAICWGGPDVRTVTPTVGQQFVQIEAGRSHTCVVQGDGQASCWGSNTHHKSSVPTRYSFSQVSAARDHTCGLTTGGDALCWGDSSLGAVRGVLANESFDSIATGDRHSCGMREDGSMACWGAWGMDACFPLANGFNKCGGVRGTGIPPLPPEGEALVQMSSGEPHCGLRADGLAVCWTPFASLGLVPPPVQRFKSISATATVACGLAFDGSATCWGDDRFGQSSPPNGRNATGEIQWPQPQNVISIATGSGHVCAIDQESSISCWGPNWWNGRFSGAKSYAAISSGSGHSCALTHSGEAICRGEDFFGESSPPPGLVLDSISLGRHYSCGLRSDGTAVCWGGDDSGQRIPPEGVRFRFLDSGDRHTCGITIDGTPVCWGRNAEDQVISFDQSTDNLAAVSVGSNTCYLLASGTIKCAGSNNFGQTDGPQDSGFVAVSAGGFLSCGLRQDGSAVCWGADFLGSLTPPPGETFTAISAGNRNACGIRPNGTVGCWGENWAGQDTPVRYVSPELLAH